MYKIFLGKRRFNNKTFPTFEEARKYVRRKVTQLVGFYKDSYTDVGFTIKKV